jgi:hypothetical protein
MDTGLQGIDYLSPSTSPVILAKAGIHWLLIFVYM